MTPFTWPVPRDSRGQNYSKYVQSKTCPGHGAKRKRSLANFCFGCQPSLVTTKHYINIGEWEGVRKGAKTAVPRHQTKTHTHLRGYVQINKYTHTHTHTHGEATTEEYTLCCWSACSMNAPMYLLVCVTNERRTGNVNMSVFMYAGGGRERCRSLFIRKAGVGSRGVAKCGAACVGAPESRLPTNNFTSRRRTSCVLEKDYTLVEREIFSIKTAPIPPPLQ